MSVPGRNRAADAVNVFFKPANALVLIVLLVVAATILLYHYYGQYRPFADLVNKSQTSPSQIGIKIDDATIVIRDHGSRRMRVSAGSVEFDKDHRTITIDNITDGTLFDNKERAAVNLQAGQVVYITPTGEVSSPVGSSLRLTGGIVAWTPSPGGPRLQADDIVWNSAMGAVQTKHPVTITFANNSGVAIADSVTYFIHTRNLHAGHIHGTFHLAKLVQ